MHTVVTLSESKKKSLGKLEKLSEKALEVLANIDAEDLEKLAEKVEKNPKLVKTALKYI